MQIFPSSIPPEPALESASPALLRRRGVAVGIDLLVCYFGIESVIIAAAIEAFPSWADSMGFELVLWSLVLLVPVYLTYTFFFEWKYARTPGKSKMDLLVVTTDGEFPDEVASATRNLLRYVDWLPAGYLIGWSAAKRSETGQRLGDRFAKTVVVRPKASVSESYVP